MVFPTQSISSDTQWRLNIVQRNLQISNWINLFPETQEQMLKEVIELSEELPWSNCQTLLSMLEQLLNHSPEDLKPEIQNILSRQVQVNNSIELSKNYSAYCHSNLSQRKRPINIFVRQPFTESGQIQKDIIQGVLNLLNQIDDQHHPLNLLTGTEAQSQDTFRQSFEQRTGLCFTARNFRRHRLQLLDEADAMIIVRTSLSESGAFEVAYNTFGGRKIPMFFAVWRQAPIKTTLLRELDELCCATYIMFDNPEDLVAPLLEFLAAVPCQLQPLSFHHDAA
ncbi:MAG: hypothetical protein AB4372_29930 [Xenococcus sp. (in: cyanobacteria)]